MITEEGYEHYLNLRVQRPIVRSLPANYSYFGTAATAASPAAASAGGVGGGDGDHRDDDDDDDESGHEDVDG